MTQTEFAYLDEEEKEVMEAYERGDYVLAPNQKELKAELQKAAKNYLQKNARTNIRLSPQDLLGIKQRAAQEGIPYQTLAASVLHKYVTGQLIDMATVQQALKAGIVTAPQNPS